jgi:hypothetical protein
LTASAFANSSTGRKLALLDWLNSQEEMTHILGTYHFFGGKNFIHLEAKSSVFSTPQTSLLALLALLSHITHFESFRVQRLHFAPLVIKPLTQNIQYLKPSSGGLMKTSGPSCESWYFLGVNNFILDSVASRSLDTLYCLFVNQLKRRLRSHQWYMYEVLFDIIL